MLLQGKSDELRRKAHIISAWTQPSANEACQLWQLVEIKLKSMQKTQQTISLATEGITTTKLREEVRQAAVQCTKTLHPLKSAYSGLKENIKDVPAE